MHEAVQTPPVQHESTIPYRLTAQTGEQRGAVYPLRGTSVTLGRGPENTIQVIDTRISRLHARLNYVNGHWTILDCASKNGTYVNDQPIAAKVRLKPGDAIKLGDTVFQFESELSAARQERSEKNGTGVRFREGGLDQTHVVAIPVDEDGDTTAGKKVPTNAEERLKSIYQIGKLFQSTLDLDELLEALMETVCRFLEPTHACILLNDPKAEVLVPRVVRRPPGSTDDLIISGSIIQRAIDERVAILMADASTDERFSNSDSVVMQSIQSAVCVPLISKGEVLGAFYLDTREPGRRYSDSDVQWAAGVATQSALAIDVAVMHSKILARHERERDLKIARTIQMNLLPKTMPRIEGFEFGGLSQPARMVGGDYFDLIPLREGDLAFTIADVSGKGVPAALLLSSLRTAVRIESRTLHLDGVIEVMRRLNESIYDETMSDMFVSMVLGYFEPEIRSLTVCNAGHVHPIVRAPDGTLTRIEAGSCFVGILPQIEFQKQTFRLEEGTTIVFLTDGVLDALNPAGEPFGDERVVEFIRAHHELPAQEFCDRLEDVVREFQDTAEQFDDLTVMALKAH